MENPEQQQNPTPEPEPLEVPGPFKNLKPATPEQLQAHQREANARVYRELHGRANIPPRYAHCKLTECKRHAGWAGAYDRLVQELGPEEEGRLLVLCGGRGTGKTRMACEVMRHMMLSRWVTYFVVLEDYLRRVRGRDTDWSFVQECFEDPRLLVIDECAKISDAPWDQRLFFDIVNKRYNDGKHTLLTCSVGPDDLDDFLGASIADRVNEGGLAVHCNWESFRK